MESGDRKLWWNSRLVVAFFEERRWKKMVVRFSKTVRAQERFLGSESIPIDIWLLTQADNVSGSEDDYFVLIEWCLTFDITTWHCRLQNPQSRNTELSYRTSTNKKKTYIKEHKKNITNFESFTILCWPTWVLSLAHSICSSQQSCEGTDIITGNFCPKPDYEVCGKTYFYIYFKMKFFHLNSSTAHGEIFPNSF